MSRLELRQEQRQVVIPVASAWMSSSLVAEANGCDVADVLDHIDELKEQGFPVSIGKSGKYIRLATRYSGGPEYPLYWDTPRHQEVWNNYVDGGNNDPR